MNRSWIILIISIIVFIVFATAFFAFKINHEIQNAFYVVNHSIESSNDSLSSKTEKTLEDMDTIRSNESKELYYTAFAVKSLSDSTTAYIKNLQNKIVATSTGDADLDVCTKLLSKGPDGKKLQCTLGTYMHSIDSLMARYPLNGPIPMDTTAPRSGTDKQQSWQHAYFDQVPAIAGLTILSKFKNDVKNTEKICIERLNMAASQKPQ